LFLAFLNPCCTLPAGRRDWRLALVIGVGALRAGQPTLARIEHALARLTGVYRVISCSAPSCYRAAGARRAPAAREPDPGVSQRRSRFIDVSTREGILEPGERELVRGVVDFGETAVRSVMTPRIDMVVAPVGPPRRLGRPLRGSKYCAFRSTRAAAPDRRRPPPAGTCSPTQQRGPPPGTDAGACVTRPAASNCVIPDPRRRDGDRARRARRAVRCGDGQDLEEIVGRSPARPTI
jgi:hypothetical protein